jgi:hypothetical protein
LKQLDNGEVEGISSTALPKFTRSQLEAAHEIHALGAIALPFLMN